MDAPSSTVTSGYKLVVTPFWTSTSYTAQNETTTTLSWNSSVNTYSFSTLNSDSTYLSWDNSKDTGNVHVAYKTTTPAKNDLW